MAEQPKPSARIQVALSELLGAVGFAAMAREVLKEERHDFLQLYAKIILKHAPAARRSAIRERLQQIGLA